MRLYVRSIADLALGVTRPVLGAVWGQTTTRAASCVILLGIDLLESIKLPESEA